MIKPDIWIERMVREKQMIEPFSDRLVRQGVVSFGVSSYGYDLTAADEFKIFHNVNAVVIDPKRFDEQSFVDAQLHEDESGLFCIVPPNSFALARTIEYMRMPANVTGLMTVKCLTGDTRVVDAETGAYLPIKDFVNPKKTMSLNDNWQIISANVSHFVPQGIKSVYELVTYTGLKIKATANHPFRKFDTWVPLSDLQPGDEIAVARNIPIFGETLIPEWEAILLGLMISEGNCNTPGSSPTFTTEDPILADLVEACVQKGFEGEVSFDGKYGYRLVNRKGRGGILTANRVSSWLKEYGLNVGSPDKFVPQAIFKAPKLQVQQFLQALFAGDGSIYTTHNRQVEVDYYSSSRRLIEDVHHLLLRFDISSVIREMTTGIGTIAYRLHVRGKRNIQTFLDKIGFWPASLKDKRSKEDDIQEILQNIQIERRPWNDNLPPKAWEIAKQAAKLTSEGSLYKLGIHTRNGRPLPLYIAQQVAEVSQHSQLANLANNGPIWDVIESINYCGQEMVYDLSVPNYENFVANDMVVHNSTYARCGIVSPPTVLEAGWEGHITIEISNTTPLPARIYANEGIAQVLFFESDEACKTSYADRKGKYQGQRGITLPKL